MILAISDAALTTGAVAAIAPLAFAVRWVCLRFPMPLTKKDAGLRLANIRSNYSRSEWRSIDRAMRKGQAVPDRRLADAVAIKADATIEALTTQERDFRRMRWFGSGWILLALFNIVDGDWLPVLAFGVMGALMTTGFFPGAFERERSRLRHSAELNREKPA